MTDDDKFLAEVEGFGYPQNGDTGRLLSMVNRLRDVLSESEKRWATVKREIETENDRLRKQLEVAREALGEIKLHFSSGPAYGAIVSATYALAEIYRLERE